MINMDLAQRAEKIAKRLAKENGTPDLHQLFVAEAYEEITKQMLGHQEGKAGSKWYCEQCLEFWDREDVHCPTCGAGMIPAEDTETGEGSI